PSTAIGSVKSMIGHCIPAAGAAGLIKTSLALYHKTLPPTLCDTVRAELGFETTALYVNNQPRPWLAPTGTKRRAAVNAFGFGGINAHAVLEEADGPAMAPSHWTTELFCISAADPAALAARARVMEAELAAHSGTELSSLAAYFAANAGSGPARLAFTAKDYDDLLTKLGKGADRLEAGKPRFRLRTGLFAADKPLEGKLAFIFPGEGAQYQGMLGETLMAFPEAREWFDFWDGLFPHRDIAPSTSVFPPPTTLSPELEKDLGERLFGLELGSESMFIAAQALLAVTKKLEIKPDAVVGHSSGEHSALAAAGIFGATDSADERADFANRIRSLNRLYQEIEAAGGIEGGALLTVGGVSRKRILEMTAAEPGLHLALDNCQHQAVLYGDRPLMEKVADALRQEGGITSFLPFDRPYHTPLFVGVAEKVAGVYADMEFRVPDLPIYSCATAAPMPNDPREIRVLAAGQWAARVRFTETIERLYADGVRLFLEVGPSANLTGFADDILKGRDAVCVAMDSRRRGGLDYLLQAMAQVWVSGRDMNIEALFASRVIDPVDLTVAPKPSRKRWIDNHLPYIRLPDDVAAPLAAELAQGRAVAPAVANILAPSAAVKIASNANISAIMPAQPATIGNDTVGNHFSLMQQFLDIQGNIMEAALGEGETAPQEWVPPLLHRIKQDENSLRAESDFDPLLDPFIAHHVLYAFEVSDADPDLQALPVLPLAVSLEMVAEAAAALTGIVPQALENVRARDWVAFDNGPATLTTLAQRLSDDRVAVQLKRGDTLLFEAEAVLGDAVPAAALPPPTAPKPPVWTEEQLYTTGMFHGPLFQGVARINGWDEGGLNATLKDMPLDGFFSDGSAPEGLLLNPALLDQTGHITAFWIAQGLGTDFSSFPSSIDRITLLDARVEATGGAQLSGRISFLDAQGNRQNGPDGARFLQGDFDCVAADGHLIAQVRGWKDRFFNVPHAFYEARYRTREAWYGAPAPLAAPDDVTLWSVPAFPLGFLEDAGGIWTRVLVTTILSASERTAYAALKGPGKRRRDWLMGRIALKEAVRAWIMKHHDLLLLPADIIIGNAPSGRPFVAAETLEILGVPGPVPVVSLSHSGGAALAACSAARAIGVDMELVGSVDPQLLAQGAFNPDELAFLGDSPAALTAGWCAKESVAKAFGQGLTGRPRSFKLVALDLSAGTATVDTPEGMRLQVQLVQHDDMVLAAAMAD
ncbi:MAG: polyketide synthase dehydratase domain-containing protein, partial [Rhodobacteraceae bacterium]|nr:polyketide synthase dehydratase domain-containing protein [Paracoccaceae bacterium]